MINGISSLSPGKVVSPVSDSGWSVLAERSRSLLCFSPMVDSLAEDAEELLALRFLPRPLPGTMMLESLNSSGTTPLCDGSRLWFKNNPGPELWSKFRCLSKVFAFSSLEGLMSCGVGCLVMMLGVNPGPRWPNWMVAFSLTSWISRGGCLVGMLRFNGSDLRFEASPVTLKLLQQNKNFKMR